MEAERAPEPLPTAGHNGGPPLSKPRMGRVLASRHVFDGASVTNPNIALWRPPLSSIDQEVTRDAAMLRARARDLYRNHPYARQAVRASRLGVIGRRMRYSCRPDHRFLGLDHEAAVRWGQDFERLWDNYAHGPGKWCDAGRRNTFTEHMALLHKARFVDGESLATMEWGEGRRWRTCAQAIDVDRLSNPHGHPDTANLKAGIALGELGEPTAYFIRHAHPGEIGLVGAMPHQWSTIPRETQWGRSVVQHSFEADRAGQTRGVSMFAPVILDMRMGREYVEATLAAAILQSSYAAVLTSQQNYAQALEIMAATPADKRTDIADLAYQNLEAAVAYHEEAQIRFNGAKVPILYPGEDLKLMTPGHKADSLQEFSSQATKSYAAGTGTDPIAVSQDYSQVNYSSAKMAAATSWRHYEVIRQELIDEHAMPHVAAFFEEVVFSGAMPLPDGIDPADFYDVRDALIRGVFLTQGAPMLDPTKERQAQNMAVTLGVMTLQDIAAEEGEDYIDKLDQRARENMELASRGLPPPGVPMMAMMPQPATSASNDEADDDGKDADDESR